jgi:hypothetical protein
VLKVAYLFKVEVAMLLFIKPGKLILQRYVSALRATMAKEIVWQIGCHVN